MAKTPPTYPAFIILRGTRVLVVGGGDVAERKALALLDAEADVTVVSPDVTPIIEKLAADGKLRLEKRPYRSGEAADYMLTVASTNDPEVNQAVWNDARGAGRLVNVVDKPDLCNFIVPSVVRRGDLTVAISTGGASPATAKWIRERIEILLPERVVSMLDRMGEFRDRVRALIADEEERKRVLTGALNQELVEKFLEGDESPMKEYMSRWI